MGFQHGLVDFYLIIVSSTIDNFIFVTPNSFTLTTPFYHPPNNLSRRKRQRNPTPGMDTSPNKV